MLPVNHAQLMAHNMQRIASGLNIVNTNHCELQLMKSQSLHVTRIHTRKSSAVSTPFYA